MLESEIKKLTAAVEANTLARIGGAIAPAADTPAAAALRASSMPAAPAAAAAAPAAAVVTKKQIVTEIVALMKDKGREAGAKLLADYGVQKVPGLDPAIYSEFLAKIVALRAA